MNPPADQKLPFFAYGVFKPGELAFLQIKDMVLSCRSDTTYRGWLLIRDGLPIADLSGNDLIHGDLISFHPGLEEEAYRRIAALEPDTQYRWEVVIGEAGRANILAGRSPKKGSVHPIGDWTGHDDPLFTAAFAFVR